MILRIHSIERDAFVGSDLCRNVRYDDMDLCILTEYLEQATGIDRPARACHADYDLLLSGCHALSCDTNVGAKAKRVCGIREVHQDLEDEKEGFSRPSLLKTLSTWQIFI